MVEFFRLGLDLSKHLSDEHKIRSYKQHGLLLSLRRERKRDRRETVNKKINANIFTKKR